MNRILHVEVGGDYGGSLRALQLYLERSDPSFEHDVLLYFPTKGSSQLRRTNRVIVISSEAREQSRPHIPGTRRRHSLLRRIWQRMWPWISLVKELPLAFRILPYIRRGEYDVVHVNNTFTYQPGTLMAAWLARKPVLAHLRNRVPAGAFSSFLASLTDGIACVNPLHAEELSCTVPVPVRTCRDPIGRLKPDPNGAAALRESLACHGEVLIGSVGRLHQQKGYEFFVRAAARVRTKLNNVRFAIAGEGEERQNLERLIEELGLADCFSLLGFREDIAAVLGAFDVFVCSSLWEGLPLTVLEAMQLGKPIVTTPVGVAPELKDWPLIVPERDVEGMAKAIEALVEDPALRVRVGEASLSSATVDDASSVRAFDAFLGVLINGGAPITQP